MNNMNEDNIFEAELLKIIEDKKDISLAFVEMALSAWPEDVLENESAWSHTDLAGYFIVWLRNVRKQMYPTGNRYDKKG